MKKPQPETLPQKLALTGRHDPVRGLTDKDGRVLQPSNEAELCNAVATAVSINDRPSCFRFPRGNGLGVNLAEYGVTPNLKGAPWEIGKGVVRRQGKDVALVGYGTTVNDCLAAAEMLAERGVSATVTDMRCGFPRSSRGRRRFCQHVPLNLQNRACTRAERSRAAELQLC